MLTAQIKGIFEDKKSIKVNIVIQILKSSKCTGQDFLFIDAYTT